MLLSRKSPYQLQNPPQQKQALSLHKFNKQMINECIMDTNDAKFLQENMLNKLLRPPAKKESKGQLRKYDPQFPKPDVERLIHENSLLKTEITENAKTILELRFKVTELEKKIKKLEVTCSEQLEDVLEKNRKNPSAHTEILKKKINELHTKYINSEAEIKRLKKLPGASIYEENNIEKQHLLAETIRLKSILTSYQASHEQLERADVVDGKQSSPSESCNTSMNNGKFQQQFLRMLKQENEKLKATIRLLENDKILMKARQTTQNKFNTDLKKEVEQAKNKLVSKEAEIEKLTHENQNLLFKKAAKFRLEKEEKQNKLIQELTKNLEELRAEKRKIQNEKNQLYYDNQDLKKKEQDRSCELMEKDKELQKIKIEISEIKSEYEARIKSLQMNKLYSKESSFGVRNSKQGGFHGLKPFGVVGDHDIKNNDFSYKSSKESKKFNWGKPVKFEELDLCLLKIWTLNQNGTIESYDDLIFMHSSIQKSKREKLSTINFEEFFNLLKEHPLDFSEKQAIKMAKYIFSDHCVVPSQSGRDVSTNIPTIEISLLLTLIKAAISQFTQCISNDYVVKEWKFMLEKSKKFIRELEEFVPACNADGITRDRMTKQQFVQIAVRNKSNTLLDAEINYVLLHAFDAEESVESIVLKKSKVLELMYGITSDPKYYTSILVKRNLLQTINKEQNYDYPKNPMLGDSFELASDPNDSYIRKKSGSNQIYNWRNEISRNQQNMNNLALSQQQKKTSFFKETNSNRKLKLRKVITVTQSQSEIEEADENETKNEKVENIEAKKYQLSLKEIDEGENQETIVKHKEISKSKVKFSNVDEQKKISDKGLLTLIEGGNDQIFESEMENCIENESNFSANLGTVSNVEKMDFFNIESDRHGNSSILDTNSEND